MILCRAFVKPIQAFAADFLIFVRSKLAAQRVFRSVERFLTQKLKLVVNRDKSRVCRTDGVEFLGYVFKGYSGQIHVSEKNVRKSKQRCREITRRNGGISLDHRLFVLQRYLRGWTDYFVLERNQSLAQNLDKWLRRRVRACCWKAWRLPRTRARKLKKLGVAHEDALAFACSRKGAWRITASSGVQQALSNEWLEERGLCSILKRWKESAPKRRTA